MRKGKEEKREEEQKERNDHDPNASFQPVIS